MRDPGTQDCDEGKNPHPARSEADILPAVFTVPGPRRYGADQNSPQSRGCNLPLLRIQTQVSSLPEYIMSQNRTTSKKKSTASPGGYHDLKPTIWIGKQGMTETIIDEIRSQIKVRKVIKVKWLESTGVDPEEIAGKSGTILLQVRGRTMVLGEKGSDSTTRSRNI